MKNADICSFSYNVPTMNGIALNRVSHERVRGQVSITLPAGDGRNASQWEILHKLQTTTNGTFQVPKSKQRNN